jgi:hypothetical protein
MDGFVQDSVTRVVNVRWGGVEQQGLLAEYPPGPGAPEFETIQDVMKGNPTAYALDSGESFDGVNMGASGLGYTVLAAGLVCFGKPRDGAACFVACPDYKYMEEGGDGLKRGILNEEGTDLAWDTTGSGGTGKLIALNFAGEAFFAVYRDGDTISIATSFDGKTWTTSTASADGSSGGNVAAIVVTDSDGEKHYSYVACGQIIQEDPADEWGNFVSNLAWATSDDGTSWSSGSNSGMMAEPGANFGIINNYSCTVAGGSAVRDGETVGLFVAAAAGKTSVPATRYPFRPFAMLQSGPAESQDGADWSVTPVGLAPTIDQFSWGQAATFVRTKTGEGYFLMSDHELISGDDPETPNSSLYKGSSDGGWLPIRTNNNWMATLSTIAKDIGKTRVIRI